MTVNFNWIGLVARCVSKYNLDVGVAVTSHVIESRYLCLHFHIPKHYD